jgi:hypothetical protein
MVQNKKKRQKRESPKTLVDAAAIARAHPNTFEVPTDDDLKGLAPGDAVKVAANSERFWVLLTVVTPAGGMIGTVDNHLVAQPRGGYKYGDIVELRRRHIYDVVKRESSRRRRCCIQ